MQRPTAFLFGSTVHFEDGVDTTLRALELTENPWTLRNLVVSAGWPRAVRRRVERSQIHLRRDGDLAADAAFASLEPVSAPAASSEGAVTRMDRSTRIQLAVPRRPTAAGLFVSLAGVVADPESGVVRSFVGNESRWRRRLVRVPAQPSTRQSSEWLWVSLGPDAAGRLTPFREDGEIADAVREAVAAALGPGSLRTLTIVVVDGQVVAEGNVQSDRERLWLTQAAAGVHGVRDVQLDVVTDPEVETAVAAALAQEGLAGRRPPIVRARLGRVSLAADFTPAEWARAQTVATAVPGVREVVASGKPPVVPGEAVGPGTDGRPGSPTLAAPGAGRSAVV